MQIPDPRERRGVRYKYADLLLIYMYAVLTGCSNATEIAYYAELKYRYFQELLGIDGIPSHDTFSRIMRMTDFEKLSESLQNWLAAEYPDICERYCGMKILHVDGKAVRAAGEKSRGEKPVYHLNAMYEGESIGVKVENLLKIKAAHWNIEMQHRLLDVQLREDMHTAGKGNAATNSSILRRFCLMVKEHDRELSKKPMSRFLMANAHDVNRIERLLFDEVANENHAEDAD